MEDNEIIDLYMKRDEQAIQASADKYGGKLRRIALGVLSSEQDAEECENEAYLKAWNSIPPNEPRGYLFSYLAKIIRNLAINKYIKEKRRKGRAEFISLSEEFEECFGGTPGIEEDYFSDMVKNEKLDAIRRVLASLPDEQRVLFVRRYAMFVPLSVLSEETGFSESKLKSILYRIRMKIRREYNSGR